MLLAFAGFALGAWAIAQTPPMLPEFHVSQDTVGIPIELRRRDRQRGPIRRELDELQRRRPARAHRGAAVRCRRRVRGKRLQVAPSATPQFDGAVAKDAAGRFVVAWFEGAGVMARRFESDGTPLGTTFTVTDSADNDVFIASDDSGNFVVTWSRFVAVGPEFDVFARVYDSSGAPKGNEFPVNTYTSLQQQARGVARRESTTSS